LSCLQLIDWHGHTVTVPLDSVLHSFSHEAMATGRPFWDDADSHVEGLIALTGDYRVARAAHEEAVRRRPGRIVTLRQKTRLLAGQSDRELGRGRSQQ
jgi:hypothetical protein